ncbi:hypothetical protein OKA04_12440 [Luteolibacter flavescens]|uniref:Uncharacterized protein n=1 Tax=Luteolibacter flavescens TaxID=1859460 RepID=A0ABT3FPP0_9BACT|nr:hypothetical protein [Luteolibacter flavescens]MCW1885540.1 hypothetical protein [Luteolibacter flavescens]
MPIDSPFVGLKDHGTSALDPRKETIHGTATLVKHAFRNVEQEWWAGIILKARDARSFSKLVRAGGAIRMTAEELKDGKIAESAYFLAHPTSGRGLVATYWGAPGGTTIERALKKTFTARQKTLRQEALSAATSDKDRAAILKHYKGALRVKAQIRDGSMAEYLKDMKTKSLDIKITSVENRDRLFRTAPPKSVTRTEHYVFPPNFAFNSELAEAAELEISQLEGVEATFKGVNSKGAPQTVSNVELKNKLVFATAEYDELHGDFFAFNHDEHGSNIAESPVIDWLKKVLNHGSVHQNLVTPQ